MKKSEQFTVSSLQKTHKPWYFAHCPLPTAHSSRGFTLLLAALVSSIVLALGVSIFEISQKQVTLSSLGRDSQFAFYAADTGAECALYWDVRYNYFATSTPPVSPTCDNRALSVAVTSGNPAVAPYYPYTMSFQFTPNGYCTMVSVTKNSVDPHTVIHADGFSTDCASITTNPRALQRSVELHY